MVIGTYISIITLNVNGLNAPTKRHRLAEWIQKQDPYVCCLQETNFRPRDTYRLKVKWGWKKIFHPLTFSLYVSLGLKLVSCRQHTYGSCFCIHSARLCLLPGAFNPFTFKVNIDMYVPITIFLIVLGFLL